MADRSLPDPTPAAQIIVCVGPPQCHGQPAPCAWCYRMTADDPRTFDEIKADMDRMNQ